MPTVDVTPESLRDAAVELVRTRTEDLDGNRHIDRLHGYENDQYISTGGFVGGVKCQDHLTSLFSQASEAYGRIYQDLFGLASALHVVADVFGSVEQDAALEFAFAVQGAAVPPGLPRWIDPDQTGRELAAEMLRQQRLASAMNEDGVLPEGWSEDSFPLYPGSPITVTEIRDAGGKLVISRQTFRDPYGGKHVTTTGYDEDGNPQRKQVTYHHTDGRESTTTESFDRNGNVIGYEEYEKNEDGSWVSTTYDPDDPGVVLSTTTHTMTQHGGWETVEKERNDSGDLETTSRRSRTVGDDGSVVYDRYDYEDGTLDKHVEEWDIEAQPFAIDFQESQEHFMSQQFDQELTEEQFALKAEYETRLSQIDTDGLYEDGQPEGIVPDEHGGIPWEIAQRTPSEGQVIPVRIDTWVGDGVDYIHLYDDETIESWQEHHGAPESFK